MRIVVESARDTQRDGENVWLDPVISMTDYNTLACPACQSKFSHIRSVIVPDDKDDRRQSVVLQIQGECKHDWSISFIQHEGETGVSVQVFTKQTNVKEPQVYLDPDEWNALSVEDRHAFIEKINS